MKYKFGLNFQRDGNATEMGGGVTATTHTAETVYISHPLSSYGIFCFNEEGDLFLNSDWGFYGFSWRAFGDDFKDFLSRTNADYIVGKFAINYREVAGKKLPQHKQNHLLNLVSAFIKSLKKSLNDNK